MSSPPPARICAVSYLNTVPLVWGMLHGPEREAVDLSFTLPSECADRLRDGRADIGLVPVVELPRQGLEIIANGAIACDGPVRSILLISKTPLERIRTLAVDKGSRTSVMLARIVLAQLHGADPECIVMPPELPAMLAVADAALVIGDPALRIDPRTVPFEALDLGGEWQRMTGLPMVFAVWAGRPEFVRPGLSATLDGSLAYGNAHIEEIVARESVERAIEAELVRAYLTRHIRFELGPREREGMERFLEYARQFDMLGKSDRVSA